MQLFALFRFFLKSFFGLSAAHSSTNSGVCERVKHQESTESCISMAAAIAAIRGRNKRRAGERSQDDEDLLENLRVKLPPKETWESEIALGMLVVGTWQQRKIILTKDKIPLEEVTHVQEMEDVDEESKRSKDANELLIETHPQGYNSGRTYYLQAESKAFCQEVVQRLDRYSKGAQERANAQTPFAIAQQHVGKVYRSAIFQNLVAILIIANFIICVMDAQYKKDGTTPFDRFVLTINYTFTVIFALELAINLFSNWFLKFARSGWNWLDMFVVVMSFVDFGPFNIPDWLVRLMRAFRIVRLFGRVHELTKMFSAITASLFPMMNAFVILIIVLSIYAILGVSLFADIAPDQFGKFNRAFITLFRISAGDTWIDALPMLGPNGDLEWKPSLFICTFIVVSVWVVLQVSVAVLLDNFVTVSMRMDNEDKKKVAQEKKASSQFQNPLEPLIAKLANDYTDSGNLSAKLASLFHVLDSNASGGLTSQEFCAAMKKLPFQPKLHMTDADFLSITRNGELCDGEGGLGPREFELVMRKQARPSPAPARERA